MAAALLTGAVASVLAARVDDVRDEAIAPYRVTGEPGAVALAVDAWGAAAQRLPLYVDDPSRALAAAEIDIAIASPAGHVTIARGTLAIGGCEWAVGRFVSANGARVPLLRLRPCVAVAATETRGLLTLWVPGGERVVVPTIQPAAPSPGGGALLVGVPGQAAAAPIVIGRYVTERTPSRVRRVHLLNHVWQLTGRPYWIGAVLALAAAGFFLAGVLALRSWPALAAAIATLSLACLYAVIVPPFEAPDEPDHLLAFADLAGRPDLAAGAADLARIGHLERIKFRTDERFRPADVQRPFAVAWNADIFALPISGRSRTTEAVWRMVAASTRGWPAPRVLLATRLVDAALLALGVGLGVALLARQGSGPAALAVVLALLLAPTICFFGVHMSEFAVLTATYIGLACVLSALLVDGPRSHALGLPLGAAIALLLAGGRSAMPMTSVVAAALAARTLLGTRGDKGVGPSARHAAIFWAGAAAGAALLIPATNDAYYRGLWPGDAARLPEWFQGAAESVRSRAWLLPAILPAGFAIELLAAPIRRALSTRLPRTRAWLLRTAASAIAAAIVGVALVSVFVDLPVVTGFSPATRPALAPYLRTAIPSVLTTVRVRHHDLLVSTFFWGAFGWVDALLPEPLVTMIILMPAAAGVWLLVGIARRNDQRRGAWLAAVGVGWVVAVVTTTLASYFLFRNLNGRYLLGLNIVALSVAATAPIVARRVPSTAPLPPAAVLGGFTLAAAIHAAALCTIVLRYF